MAKFFCALCGVDLDSAGSPCDPLACATRRLNVSSRLLGEKDAEIARLRAEPRFIRAQPIKPDSWLHDDRHPHAAEFRRFYSYLSNKTNAIPACAACAPEDLYFVVTFLDHWRERVREGLEDG